MRKIFIIGLFIFLASPAYADGLFEFGSSPVVVPDIPEKPVIIVPQKPKKQRMVRFSDGKIDRVKDWPDKEVLKSNRIHRMDKLWVIETRYKNKQMPEDVKEAYNKEKVRWDAYIKELGGQ